MTLRAVHPGDQVVLTLPTPEVIDQLPIEALPGLVVELSALAMRAGARLAAVRPPAPVEPDDLLDVDQAATLTRRSVSWLHHHGHTLPGFRQPHGRGGRKFWSRRALLAWITDGAGAG
jgi:hypothetical protein